MNNQWILLFKSEEEVQFLQYEINMNNEAALNIN